MKKIILLTLLIFSLSFISSMNLSVEKISTGEVLIADLKKPVSFDLKFTNTGGVEDFTLYNLVGFTLSPETISLNAGETKEIRLELTPIGDVKERGSHTITYYIKDSQDKQEQKTLTFRIIELKDLFSIESSSIDPKSTSAEVSIKNLENVSLEKVIAEFNSPFFKFNREFSIGPKETRTFNIDLDQSKSRSLIAGFYTMTADVSVSSLNAQIEGPVNFVERDIVTTMNNEFGFLVNSQVVEKRNDGNVIQKTQILVKKNIISRLFTSFTPEPSLSERDGTSVNYIWIVEIKPGETAQVLTKTNWLFPVIIIFFLVAIVVLTKRYSGTNIVLRKKISFVRVKGGEFALRVSILVNSKKYLERINVVDRLPPLVDVYERFGGEQPSKIDRKNKKIEWNFEKLEAGETRVLSYMIYSKVGVLGRFALPSATAIFERDGEIHEAESNRAFFVAEQRSQKTDDEE